MKKQVVGFSVVMMGALVAFAGGQQAHAASDSTNVTLNINDYTSVDATTAVTVEPSLAEIMANAVMDPDAITLTINSTSGALITWEGNGSDGTGNTINDSDITLSSNGTTFVVGDGETALYTSTSAQSAVTVPIDMKIANVQNYAIGNHTNTLTFTVVAN